MSLGRYRRDLDSVMQTLLREILALILGNYSPFVDDDREEQIEALVPPLTDTVRLARNRAHQIAARQLAEEAPRGRAPYVPDQRGYAQDAVRKVLRDNLHGSPSEAANRIAPSLVRHAEQAARDTITDAVLDEEWKDEPEEDSEPSEEDTRADDLLEQLRRTPSRPQRLGRQPRGRPGRSRLKINFGDLFDEDEDLQDELERSMRDAPAPVRPIGWARVMTGAETCAFCVMLASRPGSPDRRFYTSADAAGGELAQQQYYGTAMFVNRYHTNCDCIVVPVYDPESWSGKENAEYLYRKVYLPAVGGKPVEGWRSNKYKDNDVVKALEKWLREHEFELPNVRAEL